MISTAHKQLSQDEFQRKVAMLARTHGVEKSAVIGAALGLGVKALPTMVANAGKATSTLGRLKGLFSAGGGASKFMGGAKSLATTGILPSVANNANKTWANLVPRMLVGQKGVGSYMMHPVGLATGAASVGSAALPYVGGALQRVGGAFGGTVGGSGGTPGLGGAMGAGLLGAGLGGVAGALMPGEEEYEDENGNVRKRSRGMLAGALRGAGMGGLAGGAVGAGMDAYNSGAFKFGSAVAKLEKQAGPPSQMFGNRQSRGTTQNMFSAMAPSAQQPRSRGVITKAPSTMQNMGTLAGRFGAGIAAGLGGPARAGLAAGAGAAKGLTSAAGLGSAAGGMLGGKLFAR
jgi:hypothetical protein